MQILKTVTKKADAFGKKLSAATIGTIVAGMAGSAHAQGLDEIVTTTDDQLTNIPELIRVAAYIGGAVLFIGGVMSLKAHVDRPADKPIREGLVRLIAGVLLLAAPAAFTVASETLGINSSDTYSSGGELTF
jgi:putative copper export protein